MIELHFWPTPNGKKIAIALEELDLPYRLVPVDIGRGEQFDPGFLVISPNNRIPAIVDDAPNDGGPPVSVFESGAILVYLAEKTGRLMPGDLRGRVRVLEWVTWQVAGLGPMAGQSAFFRSYALEKLPYAIDRYANEVRRLYGVLNQRLERREFICDEYSIADIAAWPWVMRQELFGEFPHLGRWHATVGCRPAVQRGVAAGAEFRRPEGIDEKAKRVLFGQRGGGPRPTPES